jgi:hypothetical protein
MRDNGDGEARGEGAEIDRPDARTMRALLGLGEGLAMLDTRIGVAEGVAQATNDANLRAFRDLTERVVELENVVSGLIRAISTGSPTQN